MEKRGATKPKKSSKLPILLLSIFVVIFAIAFLLIFFNETKISKDSAGGENLDMEIKNVQMENDSVKINLEIDPKQEDITGIKFIFDDGKNFEVIKEDVSISGFTQKEFVLKLTKLKTEDLQKILVAPIFENEKKEPVIGAIKDTYSIEEEESHYQDYNPTDYSEYEENHTTTNQTQNNYTNQTQINYTCTDSDGGLDYYIKGTTSSWNFDWGPETDSCFTSGTRNYSGEYVLETYCAPYSETDPKFIGNFKVVECLNGCIDGACIQVQNQTQTNYTNQTQPQNQTNQTQPPTEPICGNGILEVGEFCDKINLAGETCQSLGFDAGTLGCRKNCVFDTRYCYDEPETTPPTCTTHASSSCYNGDVYWYDSCDNRQEMREDCYSDETCINGECVPKETPPTCTTHAYSECYNNDVYWYDSCNQREEIKQDCNSNEVCQNGECVSESEEELLAFPGAEGFGKYTRGAYSGSSTPTILIVDTLDGGSFSTGTNKGTFRWAVTRNYPRIVLFEVSGNINLEGRPTINNPYLTIAGESSPSPGVTITSYPVIINTNDVIIRHLRFRLGDGRVEYTEDSFGVWGGPNTYVDHCSFSWGVDEVLSLSSQESVGNVSITNCIISEAITPPGTNHRYGMLLRNGNYIFIANNLFAHLDDRAPLTGQYSNNVVITNNLLYNTAAHGNNIYFQPWVPLKSSIVGNKLIPGLNTNKMQIITIRHDANTNSRIYVEDNEGPGRTSDPWSVVDNQPGSEVIKVNEPQVWPQGFTAMPSSQVENYVLANAGARPADRDAVDERIVNDVIHETGHIINSQNDIGGWPTLTENSRALTSVAGYPSSDPHGDSDGDGYTNLEEWLHTQSEIVGG